MTTWAFTDGRDQLVLQAPNGIEVTITWLAILLMGDLAADGYHDGGIAA